jgi:hypothetical protein
MTLQLGGKECDLDPAYLPNNKTTSCVKMLFANSSLKTVRGFANLPAVFGVHIVLFLI